MPELLRIDERLAQYVCRHCDKRTPLVIDPRPALKHAAFECPLLPEENLVNAVKTYQQASTSTVQQRVMFAHILKHPEDADRKFQLLHRQERTDPLCRVKRSPAASRTPNAPPATFSGTTGPSA